MGNNIDLAKLLGFPTTIKCPNCKNDVYTNLDDYDIDCADYDGKIIVECGQCDKEIEFGYDIKPEKDLAGLSTDLTNAFLDLGSKSGWWQAYGILAMLKAKCELYASLEDTQEWMNGQVAKATEKG